MLLQNDSRLLPEVRAVGCYFLALGKIVEVECSIDFTPEQINDIWGLSTKLGAINGNNIIVSPDDVLKYYCAEAGYLGKIYQVGLRLLHKTEFWKWTSREHQTNYSWVIENLATEGSEGNHFILRDKNYRLVFDSYSFKQYKSEPIPRYLFYYVQKK